MAESFRETMNFSHTIYSSSSESRWHSLSRILGLWICYASSSAEPGLASMEVIRDTDVLYDEKSHCEKVILSDLKLGEIDGGDEGAGRPHNFSSLSSQQCT